MQCIGCEMPWCVTGSFQAAGRMDVRPVELGKEGRRAFWSNVESCLSGLQSEPGEQPEGGSYLRGGVWIKKGELKMVKEKTKTQKYNQEGQSVNTEMPELIFHRSSIPQPKGEHSNVCMGQTDFCCFLLRFDFLQPGLEGQEHLLRTVLNSLPLSQDGVQPSYGHRKSNVVTQSLSHALGLLSSLCTGELRALCGRNWF